MPQHPSRHLPGRCRRGRWRGARPGLGRTARRLRAGVLAGALILLAGCGSNSERTVPVPSPPNVATLTPQQIVTEAERALATAGSVHIAGAYRQNGKAVLINMHIGAGKVASGTVTTDGVQVELRRLGDTLYIRGDDKFLAALGPQATATKGKWLAGPVAQADQGLANLTDLDRFAGTLSPGNANLVKENVSRLNGQPAISVRSSGGARLWVAQSGKPYPLRLQRNGDGVHDILGFLEYGDYDAKVTVTAPSPTVDLASVTG